MLVKPRHSTDPYFKTKAPFGISVPRFEGMGLHPGLDPTGSTLKHKLSLAPGQYDTHPFECAYKKNTTERWKREAALQEFSRTLGYRNPGILRDRAFNRSMGGPGSYDVDEKCFKKHDASIMHNAGFGLQKRFSSRHESANPPPGTYVNCERPGHKHFCTIPTFEYDNFIDRFRTKEPPYAKPPNMYNPVDRGSVKALLTKVVSKRGPYDLFTGPRDSTTIKNYFSPPAFTSPDTVFVFPTSLDHLLLHRTKRRNGIFTTEMRFGKLFSRNALTDLAICYKDPNAPNPTTYHVVKPKHFRKNKCAFNNSVKDARPPYRWDIHPGVGRYNPKYPSCGGKRPSWVFKSLSGRPQFRSDHYSYF